MNLMQAKTYYQYGIDADIFSGQALECAKHATEAIGKMIPKKPTSITVKDLSIKCGNGKWLRNTTIHLCHHCGATVMQEHSNCQKCGQAIDWEGIK